MPERGNSRQSKNNENTTVFLFALTYEHCAQQHIALQMTFDFYSQKRLIAAQLSLYWSARAAIFMPQHCTLWRSKHFCDVDKSSGTGKGRVKWSASEGGYFCRSVYLSAQRAGKLQHFVTKDGHSNHTDCIFANNNNLLGSRTATVQEAVVDNAQHTAGIPIDVYVVKHVTVKRQRAWECSKQRLNKRSTSLRIGRGVASQSNARDHVNIYVTRRQ